LILTASKLSNFAPAPCASASRMITHARSRPRLRSQAKMSIRRPQVRRAAPWRVWSTEWSSNLVFNANAGDPATNIPMDVRDKYPGYTHIALRVASTPCKYLS
jgi:hypothetical protein